MAINLFFNSGGKEIEVEVEDDNANAVIRKHCDILESLTKRLKEQESALRDKMYPPEKVDADVEKEKEKKKKALFLGYWDAKRTDGSTRPEYYKIEGDTVTKYKSPGLIYNIEAGPEVSAGALQFGIHIIKSTPAIYEYNGIGFKDATSTHIRAPPGGVCICVDSGALYCGGRPVSNMKFPRRLADGDTVLCHFDFASSACTFRLLDALRKPCGKVLTCTWTTRKGPIRPSVALRDVGWKVRLVDGEGGDVDIPLDIVVQRWTTPATGLLDTSKRAVDDAKSALSGGESDDDEASADLKAAIRCTESVLNSARELLDEASAATGGVLGEKLRKALESLRPLLSEVDAEAKKVESAMSAFEAKSRSQKQKKRYPRLNVSMWTNPQDGYVQESAYLCEESGRKILREVKADALYVSRRERKKPTKEAGDDENAATSPAESSKTSDDADDAESKRAKQKESATRRGVLVVDGLVTELENVVGKIEAIVVRVKPVVEEIAKHTPQAETIQYTAPASSSAIDWKKITEWIDVKDYDREACDPVTLEAFGKGPVVELSCSTKRIQCVFLESTARRALTSTGVCPSCKYRYPNPGQQPTGTMRITPSFGQHCQGYPGCGSYVIHYSFSSGTQTDRNIRPGQTYNGTTRTCYLPITDEGDEALSLLKSAFRQGHLFRVGDSITTGSKNQTVWAGIHQKTSTSGGQVGHGWPDPGYFGRLRNECAASGVFSEEFLENARQDKKKWKMARQLSEEKKKKEKSTTGEKTSEEEEEKASGETTPAPSTTKKELSKKSAKRLESIAARLAEIQKALGAAMRSGNRSEITSLMRERAKLSAEKASLS